MIFLIFVENRCCTPERQCGLGEGHCNHDEDCYGELTCENSSCPGDIWQEGNYDANCCVYPK